MSNPQSSTKKSQKTNSEEVSEEPQEPEQDEDLPEEGAQQATPETGNETETKATETDKQIEPEPEDPVLAKLERLERLVLGDRIEKAINDLPEDFNREVLDGMNVEQQLDFINNVKKAYPERKPGKTRKVGARVPAKKTQGEMQKFVGVHDIAANRLKNYRKAQLAK